MGTCCLAGIQELLPGIMNQIGTDLNQIQRLAQVSRLPFDAEKAARVCQLLRADL